MEANDRDGWPLRAGARVRVCGVAAVDGGKATASWTGTVESIEQRDGALAPYLVALVRADKTGALRTTYPERCKVRRQTKAEREEALWRLRRQRARMEGRV